MLNRPSRATLQDVIKQVLTKATAVQQTLHPTVRVLLKREVIYFPQLESSRDERLVEPLLGEVRIVPWQVEMKPVVSSQPCLPTRKVGYGNDQRATGLDDPVKVVKDVRHIVEVFQNVPENHHVELLVLKLCRVEWPDRHVNSGDSHHVASSDLG